jgi:hypothetical protein
MDAEIKRKWLEALRSGKYAQGRNALLHEGKYCCLGVLCDAHDIAIETERDTILDGSTHSYDPIRKHFGLSPEETLILTSMNDVDELTFAQIAEYIEKNL